MVIISHGISQPAVLYILTLESGSIRPSFVGLRPLQPRQLGLDVQDMVLN